MRLRQAEHTAWNKGERHNEQRKTQTLDTRGGQGKVTQTRRRRV